MMVSRYITRYNNFYYHYVVVGPGGGGGGGYASTIQAHTQPFSKGGYMGAWLRQVCCGH